MDNLKEFCIIYVSTNTFENANHISKILLTERLAACCSIIPNVSSMYVYKDNITTSNEYLIMIKTRNDKFQLIENRIYELHQYDVPEIISTKIIEGNESYLQWMNDVLDNE